jgi:predicted RNase H-like nuclease
VIRIDSLANIDQLDAAICVLAAHHLLTGRFKTYGDAAEGFIVVPNT